MADRLVIKKFNEFTKITDPTGCTFAGYNGTGDIQIDFTNMTPLFGVSQTIGTSVTNAPSENAVRNIISDIQRNIGVSIRWDNYEDGITIKEKQIDGYSIIVTFKAPLKFYCLREGKTVQSISITENTDYTIPHNSFLYYDILNNTILVSNIILDSINYIMLANSHIGILVSGWFADNLFRQRIDKIKNSVPKGFDILINNEDTIRVLENRNGSEYDASIFFPKDSKFFYQPVPYTYHELVFDIDTEYIIPHNNRLYYEIATNTIIRVGTNDIRPIQDYVLLAACRFGKIVSGYFVDLALRQKLKAIEDVRYTSNVEFISRECRVNGFPANSLIGAKECKRVGINHVRVSVRITTDNEFVLEHDDIINEEARNLDGSTITNDIKVSESTLSDLEQYDFGIKYGEQFKGMKIQKLADMIELCAGIGLTLTIELKDTFTEAHATTICKMIAKYSIWHSVWVSDWIQANLNSFIAAYPDINIAYIAQVNSNAITKAASFKTANNKVRIDIFDTNTMTEDLYYQAMKQNVAIKVGSVYTATDIPKWFNVGIRYIEVENVPYPYKWLNEYVSL